MKYKNTFFLLLLLITVAMVIKPCLALGPVGISSVTAVQIIWFVGSFIGSLVRILLPLPRKSEQIDQEGWSQKYTATTVITIILALVVTGLAFPMTAIPADFGTYFTLFWLAFGTGYGTNAGLIEISEYIT